MRMQNQLTKAWEIVEHLNPGSFSSSPSLRRISLRQENTTKTSFMRKKHSEPVIPKFVFTFSPKDNDKDDGMTSDGTESNTLEMRRNISVPTLASSSHTFKTRSTLSLDHLLNNPGTIQLKENIQQHQDKAETASMKSNISNPNFTDAGENKEVHQCKGRHFITYVY